MPYKKEAFDLMLRGARALSIVEHNGIRVDVDYLQKTIASTNTQIDTMKRELDQDDAMTVWRDTFGDKTNIASTVQLGEILFGKLGFECVEKTATGRPKTDMSTLSKVDHPFVKKYLAIKKLQKVESTYLRGLLRETVNGYIHPFFNLHTTATFRSSSDAPNFQNIPIRDRVIGDMVRRALIARPRHQLVEIDYSGIEVRVAACYHQDPRMLSYIEDSDSDMHRDVAKEIFMVSDEQMTKELRQSVKGAFVFAQFYGDWYISCARNLWAAAQGMKIADGTPLVDHLHTRGICGLGNLDPGIPVEDGTFEKHVKKIEHDFWNVRFPVYLNWKRQWYTDYLKQGYLQTKTGFICQGEMRRNEVVNYPIQGSAFHCLLWSLSRLVLGELDKRKMKTKIVGQIHDSIVADVPEVELEDYLLLAHRIMTRELRTAWPWIIVPLAIEADVAPPGGSWADKKGVVL